MISYHDRAESVGDLPTEIQSVYHALADADAPITLEELGDRVDQDEAMVWRALERLLEDDIVDRRRPAPAAQPHYLLFRELTNDADTSNGPTD